MKEASSNASADELAKVTAERDALLAKSNDDASAELASTKRKLDAVVERYKQHKAQGKAAIEELQRRLKEAGAAPAAAAPEGAAGGDKEKEKALRKQVMDLRRELAKAKRDARAATRAAASGSQDGEAPAPPAPDAAVSAELEEAKAKAEAELEEAKAALEAEKNKTKAAEQKLAGFESTRESRGQAG